MGWPYQEAGDGNEAQAAETWRGQDIFIAERKPTDRISCIVSVFRLTR
jgi:hypothetical protein